MRGLGPELSTGVFARLGISHMADGKPIISASRAVGHGHEKLQLASKRFRGEAQMEGCRNTLALDNPAIEALRTTAHFLSYGTGVSAVDFPVCLFRVRRPSPAAYIHSWRAQGDGANT